MYKKLGTETSDLLTSRRISHRMRLAYGSAMDSEEVIGLLLFGAFAGVVILVFTSFVM